MTRRLRPRLILMAAVASLTLSGGTACVASPSELLVGSIDLCPNGEERPARIGIRATSLRVPVGGRLELRVEQYRADGVRIVCGPSVHWESANAEVAHMDNAYVVGLAPGDAVIRARANGLVDSVTVTVVPNTNDVP